MSRIIDYVVGVRFDVLYILLVIFVLTFLQKYHYQMLNNMRFYSDSFFGKCISGIIRFGVIIHEFAHLFFGRLFGARVVKLDLFSPTGGQVVFSQEDVISGIASHQGNSFLFLLKLLINRFGSFLSSLGPLLVGIFLNILIVNYLTGNPLWSLKPGLNLENFQISIGSILFLILYLIVFMPSFILSWQDISNFFFYRGTNAFASFFGSFINIACFIIFLLVVAKLSSYIIYFGFFYLYSFVLTLVAWSLFRLVVWLKPKL